MANMSKVKERIENIVENGDVSYGDIIRVHNLSRAEDTLLYGNFVGNKNFEIGRERVIDKNNLGDERYNIYLKYVGKKNA